jgi:hypothetical protein
MLFPDVPQPVEQSGGGNDLDERAAELLPVGGDDLAAELLVERLLAVADAEQGQTAVEHDLRSAGALRVDDRGGAAGEDDALRLEAAERLFRRVERRDFGIDAGFADATRDELCHLAAEVDDEDGFGGVGRHARRIAI